MTDKDRGLVIDWLEEIVSDPEGWQRFYSSSEQKLLAEDALALLKEQEPKSVCWRLGRAHCPSCGELFPKKQDKQYIRFCNWCGQAVKWE